MTTEKPSNVRLGVASDEAAIFNLLTGPNGLYEENALFTINPPKVRMAVREGLARHNGKLVAPDGPKGIIGVIEHEGKIVGAVAMQFSSFWYTDDIHLSEIFNFVHHEHRKTNYAQDLIQFAKWCSESLDIPLHMGIISTERVAAKVRLYKRTIPYVGGYFMHNLPHKFDQTNGVQ